MLSGSRANIAVKVFGDDLYVMRTLAARVRDAMEDVPGVVDLTVEPQTDIPNLHVHFDRPALASHGLSVEDVNRVIEAAFSGVPVTRVLEGPNAFDLVVRVASNKNHSVDGVPDIPVHLPDGGTVPLGTLARIGKAKGVNLINREQVERKIVITCNVAGRDVASV